MTTIEKVEEFFGTKFQLLSDDPDIEVAPNAVHLRELRYFDGVLHWEIWLDDRQQSMCIMADPNIAPGDWLIQISIMYGSASLRVGDGFGEIGTALKIYPNTNEEEGAFPWFSKYGERIYFSTGYGVWPAEDQNETAST